MKTYTVNVAKWESVANGRAQFFFRVEDIKTLKLAEEIARTIRDGDPKDTRGQRTLRIEITEWSTPTGHTLLVF